MKTESTENKKQPKRDEHGHIPRPNQQLLLQIARKSIAAFLDNEEPKLSEKIPDEFHEKKGVFVTLTENGKLRGCIGSLEPHQTVLEGVQENAINAAINDPRFMPVIKKELPSIKIEISVLSIPEPLESDSPSELLEKLVSHVHGVILSQHRRSATFLPSVWEELPDKQQFLSPLCMKAGLEPSAWQDKETKIKVYTTQSFEEEQQ